MEPNACSLLRLIQATQKGLFSILKYMSINIYGNAILYVFMSLRDMEILLLQLYSPLDQLSLWA